MEADTTQKLDKADDGVQSSKTESSNGGVSDCICKESTALQEGRGIEEAASISHEKGKVNELRQIQGHGTTRELSQQPQKQVDPELEKKLRRSGLDPDHWVNLFMAKLSISFCAQIDYLRPKDIEILIPHCREDWEKGALRKLVKREEKENTDSNTLPEPKEMINNIKEQIDNTNLTQDTQTKFEALNKAINIPDSEWTAQKANVDFDKQISSLQQSDGNIQQPRNKLDDKAVILHASGGRILMGVSVDQNFKVTKEHNKTVIHLDSGINMTGPSMRKREYFKETTVRQKSDVIDKSLKTNSYKINAALTVGTTSFGVALQGSKQKVETSDNQSVENNEEIIFKKEKHAFIPLKACVIKLKNITFDADALTILKNIEQQYKESNDCETIMTLCAEFFYIYGTHISIGTLHFGGVYKWIAKCNTKAKFEKALTKEIVSDALEGFSSFGIRGTNWGVGAGISGSYLKDKIKLTGSYSESELSNIHLNIDPDGGPPEEGDFQKWKQILVSNNETWSLIDRGEISGLWEVFSNHKNEFENYKAMTAFLKCAWIIVTFKYSDNDTSSLNCIDLLKHLCGAFEILSAWFDTHVYVKNLIKSNDRIQDVLELIAQSQELQDKTNNNDMKRLLTFVLDPMKHVFIPKRQTLMKWIDKENENREDLQNMMTFENIKGINDFLIVLKGKLIPHIETFDSTVRNEHQQTTEQYVTKEFTQSCMLLLKYLREHDEEQFCIFRSFLQKFDYKEDKGFSLLLTVPHLGEFVQDVERSLDNYSKTDKQHVHLMDLVVSNLVQYRTEISETAFDICYEVLKCSLNENVKNIIETNTSSIPYCFDEILLNLKSYKDHVEGKDDIFSLPVEKILDFKPRVEKTIFTMSHDSDQLVEFLEKISMKKYFPSKLSFADAIAIDSTSTTNETKRLPWFLLDNILKQNSDVFDSLQKQVTRLEKPTVVSNPETKNSAKEKKNIFGLHFLKKTPKEYVQLNPLDLMVAVFSCCTQQLKQSLAIKMHACRLAIPVVLPHEPLLFAMGSLRPIRMKLQGCQCTSPLDCPCDVISFIRLGRPLYSKSKLMNGFLSKKCDDTFFNRESPLGGTEKTVSNGLVESSFLIEKVNDVADSSQRVNITFLLNLRGNANRYEHQKNMLTSISSTVVILTTVEELEKEEVSSYLKTLCTDTRLIIALDANSKTEDEFEQFITVFMSEELENKLSLVILAVKEQERRTNQEIVDDIKTIMDTTKMSTMKSTISQILNRCSNVYVDENHLFTFEKAAAHETVAELPSSISSIKKDVVPLQQDHLHTLSQNIKKMHNPSEYKTQKYKQEINQTIASMRIRTEQLKLIPDLHPFMISFLNNIMQISEFGDGCLMFSLWLKTLLEKKNDNLDSFFGFEHLIRELGQIYEVIMERKCMVDKETYELALKFPFIPAKLLQMGLPFELLNGDITHIPITWVKAVLTELERMIGNKRCLILSVVGLQSSGKSTLLNVMFKLQFPVGHGRVTKGAFMQLLSVKDKDIPFEFVLVIDTEGLRAPELGDQNYIHDTEFATFVIGIADITIVNILGESSSEMNDVLQMVVHTLLRLTLTRKIYLKQSCVFVHQNVSDDIDNTLKDMVKKFTTSLNEKTEESANALHITDIHAFSDVIEFDEKNVWYLPSLVAGTPPMTFTNPNYSLKVAEIKNTLLHNILPSDKSCFNLRNTFLRINNVWQCILYENFTNNFRDILEMKAFSSLDKMFHELQWEVEQFTFEYIQRRKCELLKITDIKELQKTVTRQTEDIPDVLHAKLQKKIDTFHSIIENDDLKNVMMKWKQTYIMKIQNSVEPLVKNTKDKLLSIAEEIEHSCRYRDVTQDYKIRVNALASDLADKFRRGDYQEQDRKEIFNKDWILWSALFSPKHIVDLGSVRDQIISIIKEKNIMNKLFIEHVLEDLTNKKYLHLTSLQGSIAEKDIQDNHISRYKDAFGVSKEIKKSVCVRQAVNATDKLFRSVELYVYKRKREDSKFDSFYMQEVLKLVDDNIKELNDNKECKFKVLLPYKALMLKYIASYCIKEFTDLDDRYNLKHSPRSKLENYKDTAWNLFNNLVDSKNNAFITAGLFQDAIEECVLAYIDDMLPEEVEEKTLKHFNHLKYDLMRMVMIDLVKTGDFDCFHMYITDANTYVQYWLVKFINEKLSENSNGICRLYDEMCEQKLKIVTIDIRNAVICASQKVEGIFGNISSRWIEHFIDGTRILPISPDKLAHLKERIVTDDCLQIFQQTVLQHVDKMEKNVVSKIKHTDIEIIRWKKSPYTSVFEKLWGCCKICPFCNEPCEHTNKDHLESMKHSCQNHRPQGFLDFAWDNGKGALMTEVCNFLIQSDYTYTDIGSSDVVKYRHYRKKYPDWEIAPSNEFPKYWIWLFNKYKHELARINKVKPPKIQHELLKMNAAEAIKSIPEMEYSKVKRL